MSSDVLPNDTISNLCVLVLVPAITSLVIRVKHRLCDTYNRRPRQLTVDQHSVVCSNLLAFCSLAIWATVAPGVAPCHLERMVVIDLLLGMHVQRWLEKHFFLTDTAPYYEPGPLSLVQRKRRVKVVLVLTTLICACSAALSMALAKDTSYLSYSDYNDDAKEYWFLVAGLPTLHSALRTLVLDAQGCKRRGTAGLEQNVELVTNEFTITDEEEEEHHGLADDKDDDEVASI